ncbi:MAG: GGDEF domain-containing protein, partial [Actinobacteria bacterium]|nr:GGDEF domain-containing protein [Actinomycetota bacterium]
RRVAALFVDLDGFKAINDQLGHDHGDELLIQVAGRLTECLRDGDTVARLGGDEFVIVLSGPEPEENAARIAARALDLLAEPFRVGTETVHVGASIGIALGDGDSRPEALLREADAAMYLAKDRGRFRYEFPAAGMAGAGTPVGVASVRALRAEPTPQMLDQPPSTTSV